MFQAENVNSEVLNKQKSQLLAQCNNFSSQEILRQRILKRLLFAAPVNFTGQWTERSAIASEQSTWREPA